jgi:hypothetical protein
MAHDGSALLMHAWVCCWWCAQPRALTITAAGQSNLALLHRNQRVQFIVADAYSSLSQQQILQHCADRTAMLFLRSCSPFSCITLSKWNTSGESSSLGLAHARFRFTPAHDSICSGTRRQQFAAFSGQWVQLIQSISLPEQHCQTKCHQTLCLPCSS